MKTNSFEKGCALTDNGPRILVAVADYPDDKGSVALMFVHTRNLYYSQRGINVTVLNFSAKNDYEIEGIRVICLNSYKEVGTDYDLLICHAPNIRNHFLFLKKYGERFPSFIFFFHGHEILRINRVYSKPYDYMRKNRIKTMAQDIYDSLKLKIWKKYYVGNTTKSKFVFVSQWMLDQFLEWTEIPFSKIQNHCSITYNSIGIEFEKYKYDFDCEKKYDFLTIRGNIDGSKYCVDIVNQMAINNPSFTFLLVGKGEYFNHNRKADNLVWVDKTISHEEIINCIKISKCGLMPTRTDAQGLMMCEMAATGMPVITSDLPVCHEVFDDFPNVRFVKNETTNYKNLGKIAKELEAGLPYEKNDKYNKRTTCDKEIKLIEEMTGKRVH